MKRNDPNEIAALFAETDGSSGGNAPPGFKLVTLDQAGIFFPRTGPLKGSLRPAPCPGESKADFVARRRRLNSARVLAPSDDKLGLVEFKSQCGLLTDGQYQRKSQELHYWRHPELERDPDFRFTVKWKKVVDDVMGKSWESPSGIIRVSVKDCPTMPEPQAPMARPVERVPEGDTVYRKLRRK